MSGRIVNKRIGPQRYGSYTNPQSESWYDEHIPELLTAMIGHIGAAATIRWIAENLNADNTPTQLYLALQNYLDDLQLDRMKKEKKDVSQK